MKNDKKTDLTILNFDGIDVELMPDKNNETLWGTTDTVAKIFGIDRTGVDRHKNNILKEEELDKSTCAKFAHVEGKESPEWFNLKMIVAIGFRVNSQKAKTFRQIANQVIETYITQGVVINQNRITPEDLAKILRKWRTSEKSIYSIIKDVIKESASDYDILEQDQKQKLFCFVQDKFLFAITSKTACQIKTERADANKENMGLQNYSGESIETSDITVAKNYLSEKELEELEILCDNFLGFCHLKAFRGQLMTFDEITYKVNQFLEFNGYKPFNQYSQMNRKQADLKVKEELRKYKERIKLERKNNKIEK